MDAPLRIGVIGCGAIATSIHLRVLRRLPAVRITALADPVPEARARAGLLVRSAALLTSADELLDRSDVDAVVVAAPSGSHAAIALATLRSGRHIYLEKPIATTLEDGQRVAAAARDGGVVAAIGYNWRFQPLVVRGRELLRAGVIGEVRAVHTVFCEPVSPPARGWRARRGEGGGVLLDLGSHNFDLITWLLDARVERVDATVSSIATEHDSALVRLELAGGVIASSFFSLRGCRAHSLEFIGERGVLRMDRPARTLSLHGTRARTSSVALMSWRLRSLVRPRSEPSWSTALKTFVARIRGAAVELPTFDDGLRSLEIVIDAERSASVR
ncbi:MAG TPA: Gfo/Idh/MocA family oxidoreductase [Gemmatimonadaceae bacterium]|jgi:predicted dehydrogenase